MALFQLTLTPQQHTAQMLREASKRAQPHVCRAQCQICHRKPSFKHSCEFCMQWYCTLCVNPGRHQCTGATTQASGSSIDRQPFMEPQLQMPIISKAPKWAQFPQWIGEQHKAPSMPHPLLEDHSAAPPSKKRKLGIPRATFLEHSKRAGKKREEQTGGDKVSNWSYQRDTWEQWPTVRAQDEWSSSS